jgi:YegS/Rv2252/BmrU family lipid kinase
MKICFIINPKAGPTTFQRQIEKATSHLLKRGHEIAVVETQKKGDATELARQAAQDRFDVGVAVGGDGTVNEVCNGLVNTETALAVLPAGTANVYAADVKIPIWNPLNPEAIRKGAEIIVKGRQRRIDLGRVRLEDGSSRYFLMWCGVGLDAAISQAKVSVGKNARPLGYAAWAISSVMVTYDFIGTRATIETDDGTLHERILMAVISNGQLYGRMWRLAPEAKMDDGLLDVGILAGQRWPEVLKHFVGATFGRHIKAPNFHLHRTQHLFLSAREALPVHVDAETVGMTPIEVDVAPLALKIIVPPNAPPRLFK